MMRRAMTSGGICGLALLATHAVYAMLPHLDAVKDTSVLKVEVPAGPAKLATVVKLFVQATGDGQRWPYRVEVFQKPGSAQPTGVLIVRRLNKQEPLLRSDLAGLAPGRPASGTIDLTDWGLGAYVVEVGVRESGKIVATARESIYWLDAAWRKADYSADVLLPPWTPLRVSGHTVHCWGRSYTFGEHMLPSAMTSQGTSLLAGPIELVVRQGDRRLALGPCTRKTVSAKTTSTVATATGAFAPEVVYTARAAVEYDGLVMLDLSLAGAGVQTLSGVDVRIPVRGELVRYIYRTGRQAMWVFGKTFVRERPGVGRFGIAPLLPDLTGRVEKPSLPAVLTAADFMPMAWMGNDDVGLFWFCDSNRTWPHSLAGRPDAVAFVDEGDAVVLRLRIQQSPERLPSPWTLRFGIMATPMKPGASGMARRPRGWGLTAQADKRVALSWPIPKAVWDLGWPDPVDPAGCRQSVDTAWRRGDIPVFYTLNALSADRPDWKVYGDAWHLDGAQDDFWDNGRFRPGGKGCLAATCPGAGMGFAEYYAYHLGELIKQYNYGGYYRDGMFVGPCANQSHGHGVGGAIDYHMESLRRHYRYLYKVVKQQHPDNSWIIGHSSGLLALPLLAYCDSVVTAETLSAVNRHGGDYRRVVTLDEYRNEYMGRSKGYASIYIGQLRGENNTAANTRLLMALLLLHDVVPWTAQMDLRTVRYIQNTIDRKFGIADTTYFPYFKADTPAKIAGSDLHVSLYRRPDGRTLAVVVNLSDKNLRSWLRFKPAGLGLKRITRARDIEHDMDFPVQDNAVRAIDRARSLRLVEVR